MSAPTKEATEATEICEFCGFPIEDEDQQCPARDYGRCIA